MAKKYQVIYADPPWPEKDSVAFNANVKHKVPGSASHYSLMTMDKLKKTSMDDIVDRNGCVLFIWSPYRHVRMMLDLCEAWGFTFKTIGFVWVKITKNNKLEYNPGWHTKSNSEPCWIATCGRVPIPKNGSVHQVVFAPITKHSEKPYEVNKRINTLYPTLNKLEMFARKKCKGWDVWGNEVKSDINLSTS